MGVGDVSGAFDVAMKASAYLFE